MSPVLSRNSEEMRNDQAGKRLQQLRNDVAIAFLSKTFDPLHDELAQQGLERAHLVRRQALDRELAQCRVLRRIHHHDRRVLAELFSFTIRKRESGGRGKRPCIHRRVQHVAESGQDPIVLADLCDLDMVNGIFVTKRFVHPKRVPPQLGVAGHEHGLSSRGHGSSFRARGTV